MTDFIENAETTMETDKKPDWEGKSFPVGVDQLTLERELLGVFLKKPSVDLARMLKEFGPPVVTYTSRHRPVIQAAFDCLISGDEIDASSIQRRMEENGVWQSFGANEYWSELSTSSELTAEEFPTLVHSLRDYHTREQFRHTLELALGMVKDGRRDPKSIVNFVQEEIAKSGDVSSDRPQSVSEIMHNIHAETEKGLKSSFQTYETGFDVLDKTISGAGAKELILIGGAQGVGKTIMAMQMARNIAHKKAAHCLYICYEHDTSYLFKRLIPLESINPVGVTPFDHGLTERDVIEGITLASDGKIGFSDLLRNSHRGKMVLQKLDEYKDYLHFYKGNSIKTTIQSIRSMVLEAKANYGNVVLFIDYLQKVPVFPEPTTEDDKITFITQGLKDLALSTEIPIFAVVAADREGLKAKRLHIFHLRGSSAIDYEADICLILNDKSKIISKQNVIYNPSKMKEFEQWVICTVEKNRTGQKMVEIEHKKHFKYFCFDPKGRLVQETLIDEKIYNE
ncbi:MAG TPA: DnaB-like helicase C-terminal domain-containing protein [bacterium]|jgi:replicative DNA helicase